MFNNMYMAVQLLFTIVVGMYFWSEIRSKYSNNDGIREDSKKMSERLNSMRKISLTEPLTEQTRPKNIDEIVGQEEGVEALKIALCGKNPKHILIYGPPGVGKTAASRVAMECAKNSEGTPFLKDASFVEVDATVMQYDERSIADPLIGSVHDPIYQGAGAYGAAGVPQPKPGAVSKAHGGVLFIDEIGELQAVQMNRLLKVLEDRCVRFESAYYSSSNKDIPYHVHDIFKNGIPADFRLIGATTRRPEEIPPALRSRCTEIFFHALKKEDILKIIDNALTKMDIVMNKECRDVVCRYATNGRDTVSVLQTLASKLDLEKRNTVEPSDIEWVLKSGRFMKKFDYSMPDEGACGMVHALAVVPEGSGFVLPVETVCEKCKNKPGTVRCGGIMENEAIKNGTQTYTRTGTAKTSVDNVITALRCVFGIDTEEYNIYINIPGGVPVDGPSAGCAIFLSCFSALNNIKIPGKLAITGEVSVRGKVLSVGGVAEKIEAAAAAGAETVIIPRDNYCESYKTYGVKIITIENLTELTEYVKKSAYEEKNC